MPTKKSAEPLEIYQLKITLLGTSPPIWRRLLVPADVTLAQLHDVLQTAPSNWSLPSRTAPHRCSAASGCS